MTFWQVVGAIVVAVVIIIVGSNVLYLAGRGAAVVVSETLSTSSPYTRQPTSKAATDDGTRILGREALNTKKKHRCTKDIGGKNVTGWCVD